VEDAPAQDALNKFDVTEKNGGVYIKGEESAIKGGRRIPNVTCKSQGQDKVVVVGGYVYLKASSRMPERLSHYYARSYGLL
jgi:hypothetical protein